MLIILCSLETKITSSKGIAASEKSFPPFPLFFPFYGFFLFSLPPIFSSFFFLFFSKLRFPRKGADHFTHRAIDYVGVKKTRRTNSNERTTFDVRTRRFPIIGNKSVERLESEISMESHWFLRRKKEREREMKGRGGGGGEATAEERERKGSPTRRSSVEFFILTKRSQRAGLERIKEEGKRVAFALHER